MVNSAIVTIRLLSTGSCICKAAAGIEGRILKIEDTHHAQGRQSFYLNKAGTQNSDLQTCVIKRGDF